MRLADASTHLTYCTNIHAGEALSEVMDSLANYLPEIKQKVSPNHPFGVGLRLGADATNSLLDLGALHALQDFLHAGDFYVFTLNGFPYGPFHGQPVKEGAYKPDWAEPRRLEYTNSLADILAALLPSGQRGSISTVPGTFKPWAEGRIEAITNNLVDHVAHLAQLRERSGQHIMLALEPEPFCFLETIDEAIGFFQDHLLSRASLARLGSATGARSGRTEQVMREHLGICYDVCHAAVEFEDPATSIAALRSREITISKLQLSSAMRIASLSNNSANLLAQFCEPVYLHQVVQQLNDKLTRFDDLPAALAQADQALGSEWRVHFHVPIFLERLPDFDTTQAFLREILALHRKVPISDHLEVETYTWDVLPEELRQADLGSAIARELNWVLEQLHQRSGSIV